MPLQAIYRVIGVRHDGSRRLLCNGIESKSRAERLAAELLCLSSVFATVVVESEGLHPVESPPARKSRSPA